MPVSVHYQDKASSLTDGCSCRRLSSAIVNNRLTGPARLSGFWPKILSIFTDASGFSAAGGLSFHSWS
jgi:hypothetical protein